MYILKDPKSHRKYKYIPNCVYKELPKAIQKLYKPLFGGKIIVVTEEAVINSIKSTTTTKSKFMSVTYRGPKPTEGFKTSEFYDKGIILTQYVRTPLHTKGQPQWARFVFRTNGLMGLIRFGCHGKWCIDVRDSWSRGYICLTTECKNIKEAKTILFTWFKSKGFRIEKILDWKDQCSLGFNEKLNKRYISSIH